eukprot:jgi/Psemu1/313005/fgenesh1_kg.1075_\
MMPARFTPINITQRTAIRGRCTLDKLSVGPRMNDSSNSIVDARVAMKQQLEIICKKKLLRSSPECCVPAVQKFNATDDQASRVSDSNPTEFQVIAFATIIERLLFASARSLEEYKDASTLDKRLRYIVMRFLKRKLQVESHRRKCVAVVLAKDKQMRKGMVDLSQIGDFLERMRIGSAATSPSGP